MAKKKPARKESLKSVDDKAARIMHHAANGNLDSKRASNLLHRTHEARKILTKQHD